MKNYLLRFVFFLSFLCASQFLSAQCTVHGIDGASGIYCSSCSVNQRLGQTFVACETGNITNVLIRLGGSSGTHNFRIGASTNPPTATLTGLPYQTISTSGGVEVLNIVLSPPFSVVNGNTYAFEIETVSSGFVLYEDSNDYTDGSTYFDSGGGFTSSTGSDYNFEVQISGSNNIPTLSEWGLILLALLLMTLGTVYLLQPNWKEGLNRACSETSENS